MHFTGVCKFSCKVCKKPHRFCKKQRGRFQNAVRIFTSMSTHFSMSSTTIYS